MKLLITGGHVTPALACIDVIKDKKLPIEIIFVGRKFAQEGDTTKSLEYQEITKRNIHFIHLSAGRVTRTFSVKTLLNILKIPSGFMQAWQIITEEQPNAILSFGGYLALPIAMCAYIRKIPVYTHEQTMHPGLANKIMGTFATKVFVAWPETKSLFPPNKVVFTGNPIREEVFKTIEKPFEIPKTKPVIYITGGSLGAHSINVHIENILHNLLEKYIVIHQIGNVKEYEDLDRLENKKHTLPSALRHNYFPVAHFLAAQIGYIYSQADLIISRSGANTAFEIAALQKPTIFIPLPWSAHGEQQKHAEIFQKAGVAEIFHQDQLSRELLATIDKVMSNLSHYKNNFSKLELSQSKAAAETIIAQLET